MLGKMSCWGDAYKNLMPARKAQRGNRFLLGMAERSRQDQVLLCPPASQSPSGAAYVKRTPGSPQRGSTVCRGSQRIPKLSVRMGLELREYELHHQHTVQPLQSTKGFGSQAGLISQVHRFRVLHSKGGKESLWNFCKRWEFKWALCHTERSRYMTGQFIQCCLLWSSF